MQKKDLSTIVAANVKAHMEARGLKQTALATLAKVSQKTISNLLSNQDKETRPKSATLESVEKVAAALKIEPWKLLMDLTKEERLAWDSIETAFNALHRPASKPELAATSHAPLQANGSTG